jgi:hypothetical protein
MAPASNERTGKGPWKRASTTTKKVENRSHDLRDAVHRQSARNSNHRHDVASTKLCPSDSVSIWAFHQQFLEKFRKKMNCVFGIQWPIKKSSVHAKNVATVPNSSDSHVRAGRQLSPALSPLTSSPVSLDASVLLPRKDAAKASCRTIVWVQAGRTVHDAVLLSPTPPLPMPDLSFLEGSVSHDALSDEHLTSTDSATVSPSPGESFFHEETSVEHATNADTPTDDQEGSDSLYFSTVSKGQTNTTFISSEPKCDQGNIDAWIQWRAQNQWVYWTAANYCEEVPGSTILFELPKRIRRPIQVFDPSFGLSSSDDGRRSSAVFGKGKASVSSFAKDENEAAIKAQMKALKEEIQAKHKADVERKRAEREAARQIAEEQRAEARKAKEEAKAEREMRMAAAREAKRQATKLTKIVTGRRSLSDSNEIGSNGFTSSYRYASVSNELNETVGKSLDLYITRAQTFKELWEKVEELIDRSVEDFEFSRSFRVANNKMKVSGIICIILSLQVESKACIFGFFLPFVNRHAVSSELHMGGFFGKLRRGCCHLSCGYNPKRTCSLTLAMGWATLFFKQPIRSVARHAA